MTNGVEFSFERIVTADALLPLLRQTDWAAERSANEVTTMLDASAVKLGAWDGDRLVAFARAVTDLTFRALIDDVVVDVAWRGRGIGTALLRQMDQRLAAIEKVFLRCDTPLIPFYERLGYRRSEKCMDLVERAEA